MNPTYGLVASLLILFSSLTFAESISGTQIEVDSHQLSEHKRALIQNDFDMLYQLPLQVEAGSDFEKVFGGLRTQDIVRYLNERLHYVGYEKDDLHDRGTYAANYSGEWIDYVYRNEFLQHRNAHVSSEKFEKQSIPILSPRTGFISVGGAYDLRHGLIDRLDTWVHEARHSDCPHLLSGSDFALYGKSRFNDMSTEGLQCTQFHVKCAKGHVLSGELACDAHPWGAYSLGYIFSHAVYQFCADCSEEDRQSALAAATDDFSRLSPEVQTLILDHHLPAPDMGSLQ